VNAQLVSITQNNPQKRPNLNHFHKKTTCTTTEDTGQDSQNVFLWPILLPSGLEQSLKNEAGRENFFSDKYLLVL